MLGLVLLFERGLLAQRQRAVALPVRGLLMQRRCCELMRATGCALGELGGGFGALGAHARAVRALRCDAGRLLGGTGVIEMMAHFVGAGTRLTAVSMRRMLRKMRRAPRA